MVIKEDRSSTSVRTITATTAPDPGIFHESCLIETIPEPCAIVIAGASGDLTSRKVIPALFNLYLCGALPDPFLIIGCARTRWTDQDFRDKMKEAILTSDSFDPSKWKVFSSYLHYRAVDYEDLSSFKALAESIKDLGKTNKAEGNMIFYFAIPPSLYKSTAQMLGRSGLSAEEDNWSRIVVEKPFGRDLDTAIDLDRALHEHFKEHQIFRIDHYLAKETVQNILMFRFANSIFEPVWDRRYIDHITIMAAESLGVEHRSGYYEQAGVLRDMFQNHMMQLLAMTAMEPPSLFEANRIRDEKVKVYRALRPFPVENLNEYLVLGQYSQGFIDGKKVPAYREEPGVRSESLIPTFAMMKVFLDNWRWQGVPFYLTSGKRLTKKLTEISIQFKQVPHSMFRRTLDKEISANRLILGIYPDERVTLTFQTKTPGAEVCLRSVTMDFNYRQGDTGPSLEAYEKVLLDCMLGDHMLFWRQDGVELCWSFLTPILKKCETCDNRSEMLFPYEAGTWGPKAIEDLQTSK
ncbi:glucose-6-phosphate dehydrogenase [Deltaproteobacteria bacterium]|nr:glucose-6-phosphate dehydrogenase [Deltaproteobacteria bacterium]